MTWELNQLHTLSRASLSNQYHYLHNTNSMLEEKTKIDSSRIGSSTVKTLTLRYFFIMIVTCIEGIKSLE